MAESVDPARFFSRVSAGFRWSKSNSIAFEEQHHRHVLRSRQSLTFVYTDRVFEFALLSNNIEFLFLIG